ncbi:MAG: stage II sporulation protein M [Candidatus Berkelbacteria bacterium]|nr:stage II sporulation protein M [Candidatus Berkelbacteria bacterium]
MQKLTIKFNFWKYFYISLLIFLLAFASGFAVGGNTGFVNSVLNQTFGSFEGFLKGPHWEIFLFIFLNNSIKALAAICLGFLFGLFPFYILAANGFLIGMSARYFASVKGWQFAAAGFLPHGLIELAGFFLACSLGLWMGWRFIKKFDLGEPLKPYFLHALNLYWKIVLPLLFLAALVETYVTPKLLSLFK